MGWLFTKGQTRGALIQERIRGEDNERVSFRTIAHCTRGNVLWTVREVIYKQTVGDRVAGTRVRFIGCDLLACEHGLGWGYKDMDESMHPHYYSCPLRFLDMAPELCSAWRARVRADHAQRHRRIRIGEIWSLQPGFTVRQVEIVSVKPLQGIGRPDGRRYRLRRNVLAERLDKPPEEAAGEPLPVTGQTTGA